MIFTVSILLKLNIGSETNVIVINKDIAAANEEQAQRFAIQMFDGFLSDNVTIETEIINS